MRALRIRQVVVAAADRDAVSGVWRRELGLGEPFDDPLVDQWGLHNAVFPVGDAFLEVVSPRTPGGGSPVERHLARRGGDCGYMAIFQVDDLDDGRRHLAANGLRSVLDLDHDDIRSTHVHPADVGAAIVSLDQPVPASSWRWGGPAWAERSRAVVADGIAGVRLAGPDPAALLGRWARALDVVPDGDRLVLDDRSTVTVGPGEHEGLVGVDLWAAPGAAQVAFRVAGTEFRSVRR